jgi:hypothetical protein
MMLSSVCHKEHMQTFLYTLKSTFFHACSFCCLNVENIYYPSLLMTQERHLRLAAFTVAELKERHLFPDDGGRDGL